MLAAGRETSLYGVLAASVPQLGAEQHGVFALGQLEALGLTTNAVQKRAAAGRLFRIHRGVYALVPGSMLTREGHWMAAVLAAGHGAALSHRSAAHLHGLRPTSRERIDVIVPGASARAVPGVDVHRSVTLADQDVTAIDSIPVTTLSRMILDLAAVVERRAVERVINEAVDRGVFGLWAVNDQLERNPKHPGLASVRAALGPDRAGLTDSELEERFVSIWWPTGLPRPQTRFHIDPGDGGLLIRADFAWSEAKFDLEIDGSKYHASDRRRNATTGVTNGSSALVGRCCASATIRSTPTLMVLSRSYGSCWRRACRRICGAGGRDRPWCVLSAGFAEGLGLSARQPARPTA
jgi:Transcriptional regulator, AbiEi antitoxin